MWTRQTQAEVSYASSKQADHNIQKAEWQDLDTRGHWRKDPPGQKLPVLP